MEPTFKQYLYGSLVLAMCFMVVYYMNLGVTDIGYASQVWHVMYKDEDLYKADGSAYLWPAEREEEKFYMNTVGASVAVGGAVRLKKCSGSMHNSLGRQPIIEQFLRSFCKTASVGFTYYIYFAYDYNDPCLSSAENVRKVVSYMKDYIKKSCSYSVDVRSPRFIQCPYTGKPAWAQNDAMMAAYWHNVTYFYRINDDTIMKTPGWTETFVRTLNSMDPANIGVTGPTHQGGNTNILTYDFTHRSHPDIFGFYYPRDFTDWHADAWITHVYARYKRMEKLPKVKLVHTIKVGTRYKIHRMQESVIKGLKDKHARELKHWLKHLHLVKNHTRLKDVECSNAISFVLYNTSQMQYLAYLRNVLTIQKILPYRWCSRLYVPDDMDHQYTHVLERYGAQVYRVTVTPTTNDTIFNGSDVITAWEAQYWPYLSLVDAQLDYVIVKHSTKRLSLVTAKKILAWEESSLPVFCDNSDANVKNNHSVPACKGTRTSYLWSSLKTKPLTPPYILQVLNQNYSKPVNSTVEMQTKRTVL